MPTYIKQITQGNTLSSNPCSIIIALLLTTLHKKQSTHFQLRCFLFCIFKKTRSPVQQYDLLSWQLVTHPMTSSKCLQVAFFFQGGQGPRRTNGAYSGRLGFRPAGKFQILTRQGVILWSSIVLLACR